MSSAQPPAAPAASAGSGEAPPATGASPRGWRPLIALLTLFAAGNVVTYRVQRDLFACGNPLLDEPLDLTRAHRLLVTYGVVTIAVFAAYVALVREVWRMDPASRSGWRACVAVGCAMHAVWSLATPVLSIDLFTYIVHARSHTFGALSDDQYLAELVRRYAYRPAGPSIYGPMWNAISEVLADATDPGAPDDIPLTVHVFKTFATLCTLASAWVVHEILAFETAARRRVCTIAFLFNPALLVELSGEGHNDAPTVLFALLAVLAFSRRSVLGFVAASLAGILIKYTPVFLVLPFVFSVARPSAARNDVQRRRRVGLLWVAGVAALLVTQVRTPNTSWLDFVTSTWRGFWALYPLGWDYQNLSVLARDWLDPAFEGWPTFAVLRGAFVLLFFVALRHARDFRTATWSAVALLTGFTILVDSNFWAWHHVLPIAIAVLLYAEDHLARAVLLSLTLAARLCSIVEVTRVNHIYEKPTAPQLGAALGLLLPLGLIGFAALATRRDAPERRATAPTP